MHVCKCGLVRGIVSGAPSPLLTLCNSQLYSPDVFPAQPHSSFLLPSSALQFADIMSYGSKISVISMGQGQGPKAAALIATARKAGSWVLLQV